VIVLDANVLIAHLDGDDAHHDRATALLLEVAEEPLRASRVTLAEVLVGPARAGRLERANAALGELAVVAVGLDEEAPVRLAALRAGTGLKLPDCCVLLVAEQVRGEILTFGERLAAVGREHGLHVREQLRGS
jgi:predicted nucleic acid-binding protein